jgi:hypothetical protein
MANKKWLNHYIAREGDWQSGDAISIDEDKEVTFSSEGGANVRLYETSRSGCVLISKTGGGGEAVAGGRRWR